MAAYLCVILVCFNLIALLTGFLDLGVGLGYAQTGIALGAVVAADAIIAIAVRLFPEKKIDPFARIFTPSKTERKFYTKIRLMRWKFLVPETGKYLCNFDKDKIAEPHDNAYVLKFMRETVYASVMHIISVFVPFAFMPFLPISLAVSLSVCGVNAFLQLLPFMVQRFNRPRLAALYRHNEKILSRKNADREPAIPDSEKSEEIDGE